METSNLLSRLAESANVGRAFGTPIEVGGITVISTAFVIGTGGAGGAEGPMPPSAASAPPTSGKAKPAPLPGIGGGYANITWPLGVYEVRDGNVRWVPAVDFTRVAIAAIGIVKLAIKVRALNRARRDR